LILSRLNLVRNYVGMDVQKVGKQVRTRIEGESVRSQALYAALVDLQNTAGTVGNQNGLIKQVQKSDDDARWDGFLGRQLDNRTTSQLVHLMTLVRSERSAELH
jgi:hypothetical protein